MHRLHNQMIEELEKSSANNDKLWLVETQTFSEFGSFYGDELLNDFASFSPSENKSIIYYHENGDILQFATFNENDTDTINKAVEKIAGYLN